MPVARTAPPHGAVETNGTGPAARVLDAGPDPAAGPRLLVLIPAHNEEDRIGAALASLEAQSLRPTWVVVVADNCTDGTVEVARSAGARVFRTVGNRQKKAGGLNQALQRLLDELELTDHVLVMDADSRLAGEFCEQAESVLVRRGEVGAVGGVFYGDPGNGLVGALQRNEYARYGLEIHRKGGRAVVLTGTATVFRVRVLRAVAQARGAQLPGRPGSYYDTLALTEDNEMTLAVKTLGWKTVSPRPCRVYTEIMPTWSDLWHQRLRWQRGALENLRNYGPTPITLPYLLKQIGMYAGTVAIGLFLFATGVFIALGFYGTPSAFWLAITVLFVVERIVTVRWRGFRGMVLAAPLLPEFCYDLFQQAVFLRAAYDAVLARGTEWRHVTTTIDTSATEVPTNG